MKHPKNAAHGWPPMFNTKGRHWALHVVVVLLICIPLFLTSCGKPAPKRIVERYLEEITKPEIDEERIELYTMERFRERLKQNALLAEIMTAGGNYYNLFAPVMAEEDYQLIQEEYDFKITYKETIEGKVALVQVTVRPLLKRGVKNAKAVDSETLHALLKQILKESIALEFKFALRLVDEDWKIREIINPGILDEVIFERATPTVTVPMPGETDVGDDPEGESEGAAVDDT